MMGGRSSSSPVDPSTTKFREALMASNSHWNHSTMKSMAALPHLPTGIFHNRMKSETGSIQPLPRDIFGQTI